MTGMLTAWQRQTDPQRVDAYTRWTLYLLLASAPLVAVSIAGGLAGPAGTAFVALVGGQTVAAIGVVRGTLVRLVAGAPLSRPWLVVLAGTTTACLALAVVVLPAVGDVDQPVRSLALLLALVVALLAVSPLLGSRILLAAAVVIGAVVAVAEIVGEVGGPGEAWVVGVVCTLVVWGMALSFRISGWMLGVVWEQERSRTVHAQLAVAEERLRFSRDLHDVVGRTLSAIAVKSELAAELARRGQDGAVEQMAEVRELAQESLREVRGVVSGLRTADLAAELTGARSVLRSAGIDTRVVGEDVPLPDDVQRALAWVVREAVTNVVRHAHARRCTIDLDVTDGVPAAAGAGAGAGPGGPRSAVLTITNDGVPAGTPGRPGPGWSGSRSASRRWAARSPRSRTATASRCGPRSRCSGRRRTVLPCGGRPTADRRRLTAWAHDDPHPPGRRRDPHPRRPGRPARPRGRPRGRRHGRFGDGGRRRRPPAPARRRRPRPADAGPGRHRRGPAARGRGPGVPQRRRDEPRPSRPPQARPHRRRRRVPAQDRVGPRARRRRPAGARRGTVRRPGALAAEAISAGESPLTPREADVLELAAGGAGVEEIAQRAHLSPGTVRNYLSAAATKLGAANRHEAVHVAQRHGWI